MTEATTTLTRAETLHAQVRDAVHCHADEGQVPSLIRLHIKREEVLAA